MSFATVRSCAIHGVRPRAVQVEVHVGGGLPSMSIVGLPSSAVREARDRVRAALAHLRFDVPQVRVTVNLAPADVPKGGGGAGGGFDLPIALGLLLATRQLPPHCLDHVIALGELGLSGELRAVPGVLPVSLALAGRARTLLLPAASLPEAALGGRTLLLGAATLAEACELLRAGRQGSCRPLPESRRTAVIDVASRTAGNPGPDLTAETAPDMADVVGQPMARRAVEIAAAGGHALLLHGPPGTGKSMLARRLPTLCAELAPDEALEVAAVHSVAGHAFDAARWAERPFRAPHHTASAAALVGGGGRSRPGEITLAHRGVLFLDELAEFPRRVLDALREPIETGRISVVRAEHRAEYPAAFHLVAAMNPCPCGHAGDPQRCRCGDEAIARYRARVSGPLLDRIDLVVSMARPSAAQERVAARAAPESSAAIRPRVLAAVERQRRRQGVLNARLPPRALVRELEAAPALAALLARATERLGLSRRGAHRALRVARTIADLAGREALRDEDLAEALGYRPVTIAVAGPATWSGSSRDEPVS